MRALRGMLPTPRHHHHAEDAAEAEAEAGLSSVVDAVQAELVGNSLDRMSKELRRYTEERRIAEIRHIRLAWTSD